MSRSSPRAARRDPCDHERPGRGHQRAVRSGKHVTDRLDRAQVEIGIGLELRGIAFECRVDHTVAGRRASTQAVEIVQVTDMDSGTHPGESLGARLRTGKAENLVVGADEFLDHGGAYPTGSPRHEYAHRASPSCSSPTMDAKLQGRHDSRFAQPAAEIDLSG
jgi:hypothetical protein